MGQSIEVIAFAEKENTRTFFPIFFSPRKDQV